MIAPLPAESIDPCALCGIPFRPRDEYIVLESGLPYHPFCLIPEPGEEW